MTYVGTAAMQSLDVIKWHRSLFTTDSNML